LQIKNDQNSSTVPHKVPILELTRVRFKKEVGDVAAGELGTVVHVYPHGLAYEVEFNDQGVVTCEPEDLEIYNG
jgi:hypothetical protein